MSRLDGADLAENRWNCVLISSSPRRNFVKKSSIRSCLLESASDMVVVGKGCIPSRHVYLVVIRQAHRLMFSDKSENLPAF